MDEELCDVKWPPERKDTDSHTIEEVLPDSVREEIDEAHEENRFDDDGGVNGL